MYDGNAVQTTKYGIIWSQNVDFITTVPLTRRGVLYPRVRDFGFKIGHVYIKKNGLCLMV